MAAVEEGWRQRWWHEDQDVGGILEGGKCVVQHRHLVQPYRVALPFAHWMRRDEAVGAALGFSREAYLTDDAGSASDTKVIPVGWRTRERSAFALAQAAA